MKNTIFLLLSLVALVILVPIAVVLFGAMLAGPAPIVGLLIVFLVIAASNK